MPYKYEADKLAHREELRRTGYKTKWYQDLSPERKSKLIKCRCDLRKSRNIEYKTRLINDMGGKCSFCPETHYAALQFHHKKIEEKEKDIANMLTQYCSFERIKKEADKCILICANCHLKFHYALKQLRM